MPVRRADCNLLIFITLTHARSLHADEILVLRKGEIVERGTHEELLQREGEYAEMWHRQLAEISSVSDGQAGSDSGAGVAPLIDPSLA
jgi:ABC-type transport system involved in cytochrome bd biosynthesis fused ATPase/permease subunit